MRSIFTLLSIFLLGLNTSTAQSGPRQSSERMAPAIGSISGKIIDSRTKEAVEYASIALINPRSNTPITGGISGIDGTFKITEIPLGKYNVQISFMGYQTLQKNNVLIGRKQPSVAMGELKMQGSAEILEDIVLTAESTTMVNKIDKKVVNVGKDLLAAGADASFILSNIPSVDVDIDGSISLRGNENVRILLDGKPTNMSSEDLLAMLPADAIEKVELITNPSAKYDPDGMSGIINIITRKDKRLGLNGSVSAGIGTGDKYNGALNLNYREGKLNFFTNYSYSDRNNWSKSETYRSNFNPDPSREFINDQFSDGDRFRKTHSTKAGMDYFINEKNTLSYTANFRWSENGSKTTHDYQFYDINKSQLDSTAIRLSDNKGNFFSQTHNLNYKKLFDSRDHYLEFDVNYDISDGSSRGLYSNQTNNDPFRSELDRANNDNQVLVASADYYKEGEKQKMEFGVRATIRSLDNPYTYQIQAGEDYLVDEGRTNHFQYDEQVFAAYGIYAYTLEKWTFQGGLRAEQVYTDAYSVDLDSSTTNNYFALYPSVHIIHKFDNTNEIMLNYSKRVSRPSMRQLNPTPSYSDPLNIRSGNPFLQPEFTHSIELSYSNYWQGGSFNSAVFYRYSDDVIRRVVYNEEGVTRLTFENLDNSSNIGFEASVMSKLWKWWSLNASLNAYYTQLNTENNPDFNNNGVNWSTRINNNFTISKTWSATFSGRYYGRRVITQGSIDPMTSFDLGVKKEFLNKRASLSFRVSDVFNTFKFDVTSSGANFDSESLRNWESQVFFLNFSYRFGEKTFKRRPSRRNSGSRNMSGGMGEEMM